MAKPFLTRAGKRLTPAQTEAHHRVCRQISAVAARLGIVANPSTGAIALRATRAAISATTAAQDIDEMAALDADLETLAASLGTE